MTPGPGTPQFEQATEPDYLAMLVDRLLREGLLLFSRGRRKRAITKWRIVLQIVPHHPAAIEYLTLAGDLPAEGPQFDRTTLRVYWLEGRDSDGTGEPKAPGEQALERDPGAEELGARELYEVLFDRAKRAMLTGAWELAATLLETCVHRRVNDDRAWRLLTIVREQMELEAEPSSEP